MAMNKKIWLPLTLGVLLASLIFFKFDYLKIHYINYRYNHNKPGDKLTVPQNIIDNYPGMTVPIMRLSKSINGNYRMVSTGSVEFDSLKKQKSNYVGSYLSHKVIYINNKSFKGYTRIFGVKPNWKAVDKSELYQLYKTDPGYNFVDSIYYIPPMTFF